MKDEMHRAPAGDVVVYDDGDEACRYQIARIREWDTAQRLTLIPASDPRALIWYGATEAAIPSGTIAFFGLDGSASSGEEAIARILDALPSGKGRMFAVMLGDRPRQQGDPSKALWKRGNCATEQPLDGRPPAAPRFDERGQLRQANRIGH